MKDETNKQNLAGLLLQRRSGTGGPHLLLNERNLRLQILHDPLRLDHLCLGCSLGHGVLLRESATAMTTNNDDPLVKTTHDRTTKEHAPNLLPKKGTTLA
jgi:hypothetical protein